MKKIFVAMIAAGVLALAGCSTPTHVKSGPIHATTFDFVQGPTKKPTKLFENEKTVHEAIQQAITANLAQKGVARAEGGGDIKVAYLIIVGNNVSTMAINDYFGYNRDDADLMDKAHKAYTMDRKNPDYFEAGTLLIDVLDAQTFKLLMRNYVVRPIDRDAPADVRAQRIQAAVDEALAGLQLKQ